uniref:Uncharacterized protein n=1 Tax=Arundo donax TaxID=35708 RepID=A0A0A9DQ88_ARUDO
MQHVEQHLQELELYLFSHDQCQLYILKCVQQHRVTIQPVQSHKSLKR